MNDLNQHIDDYLDGELTPEMKKYFQEKLSEMPSLREEIDFHRQVRDGLDAMGLASYRKMLAGIDEELDQEGFFSRDDEKKIIEGIESIGKNEFINLVADVDQELAEESFYEKKSGKSKARIFSIRRRTLAVAASVAVLIASLLVIWSIPPNHSKLYQENFAAVPDLISSDLLDEKSEIGFVGSDDLLDSLETAMKLYARRDYQSFIQITENLLTEEGLSHYYDRILLHRGIAFLVQNNYDQAQQVFARSRHPKSDWYMLLTYLAQNQTDAAIEFYEALENPSQEIQDLIRKF